MDRKQPVFDFLDARGIRYEWYEHPEAPTIEIARQWWRDDGSKQQYEAKLSLQYRMIPIH